MSAHKECTQNATLLSYARLRSKFERLPPSKTFPLSIDSSSPPPPHPLVMSGLHFGYYSPVRTSSAIIEGAEVQPHRGG